MLDKAVFIMPLIFVEFCSCLIRLCFSMAKKPDPLDLVWGIGDMNPFHPLLLQFYILRRNLYAKYREKAATFSTAEELCQEDSLFSYNDGRFNCSDFLPPPVIVVDNFYDDPVAIRNLALSTQYIQYARDWFTSALWVKAGVPLEGEDYFKGFRHNDDAVVRKLSDLVGAEIDMQSWESMGDGWNGAFHYKSANALTRGDGIHHHWKPWDVSYGWSGLVYLNQDENPAANRGTSIWRDLTTGKCIASSYESFFDRNFDAKCWEKVLDVEPKFNRLVLFRCDIFHLAGLGFGNSLADSRLFQTFFFSVRKTE